jgi:hypothetical protein
VQTGGTTGDIRNLTWSLQSAPATNATAWIIEGTERTVPSPWNGAAIVRGTLTWDDLITIVNGTGGERISPGLMQNLISSAIHSVTVLGLNNTHTAAAGLPNLPANAGGYLNDWLLAPARSIFIAGAELRANYKFDETFFDLPLAACAYNTGRVAVRRPTAQQPSPWGLNVDNAYVPRGAPFFNAAATLFNGTPAPTTAPSVRFMR